MKSILRLAAVAALLAVAGCATSSPEDRIAARQAEFATWPPEVQAGVRQGLVAVGYTPDQVFVALGNPVQKTMASGPQGTTEVWVYHRTAPRLSVAIGGASFGSHGAVGGGVSANGIPLGRDMSGHVVFTNGRVSEVVVTSRGG